jgi:hypothetical protein
MPPNSIEGLVALATRDSSSFVGIVRIAAVEPAKDLPFPSPDGRASVVPTLLANFEVLRAYYGTPPHQLAELEDGLLDAQTLAPEGGRPPQRVRRSMSSLEEGDFLVIARTWDGALDGAATFYGFSVTPYCGAYGRCAQGLPLTPESRVDLRPACGWDEVLPLAEVEAKIEAGFRDAMCRP